MVNPSPVEKPVQPHRHDWPTWAEQSRPRDLERREILFEDFSFWMASNAPDVWNGTTDLQLLPEQHEQLRGKLLATAQNVSEYRALANWWDLLIEAGNQTRIWTIRFAAKPVPLPEFPPTLVLADFQLLAAYRPLEAAFRQKLLTGIGTEHLRDAFLCSAFFYGGIVAKERLAALLRADWSTVAGAEGWLWLMLEIPEGKKSTRLLRWYPDALTSVLLVRLRLAGQCQSFQAGKPADELLQAMVRLGLPPWPAGWRETDLLRAGQVALTLDHSGVVAAYLANAFTSHSVPPSVLARLAHWKLPIPATTAPEKQCGEGDSQAWFTGLSSVSFSPDVAISSQRAIAREAFAALRKNSAQAIQALSSIQEHHMGGLWPITFALIEWVKWRIHPDLDGVGIKPVSALRYFHPMAKWLIYEAEDEDLLSLDVEDFECLYELAAAHIKTEAERALFWTSLRSFHDYLFRCGVPEIEFRELDGWTSDRGPGSVSANLVSETEFRQFKSTFLEEEDNLAARRVFFAGMLGFRVGLRRREVQMLQLRDFHPGPEPFLLIRPSRFASLKSRAAKRRIPLKALLPAEELAAFNAFVAQRQQQTGARSGLIFAEPASPDVPLSMTMLIDPVTQAFQCITGESDPPFCFHHLRHSFANWFFLALLASDQPDLLDGRPAFIDSVMLAREQAQAIRSSFFPRAPGTEATPDRRHLYQVAALMGHLSPATTLRSYLHLLDWIAFRSLDLALDRLLADVGGLALARVCDITASSPYKTPYRQQEGHPVTFLRTFIKHRAGLEMIERLPERDVRQQLHNVRATLLTPKWPGLRLVAILVDRRLNGSSVEQLAHLFQISPVAVETAYNAYRQMYAKQSIRQPKQKISPPHPPRVAEDSTEFWRIIKATESAYAKAENRQSMQLAAVSLIRRNGPRTGNLYFGKRIQDAPEIVRGLLLMGIPAEHVTLAVRLDPSLHGSSRMALVINQIHAVGVAVVAETLDWVQKHSQDHKLRLEIRISGPGLAGQPRRWEGRVRGMNFAAMWVRFVVGFRYVNPARKR